jgi:hypothetical protein
MKSMRNHHRKKISTPIMEHEGQSGMVKSQQLVLICASQGLLGTIAKSSA